MNRFLLQRPHRIRILRSLVAATTASALATARVCPVTNVAFCEKERGDEGKGRHALDRFPSPKRRFSNHSDGTEDSKAKKPPPSTTFNVLGQLEKQTQEGLDILNRFFKSEEEGADSTAPSKPTSRRSMSKGPDAPDDGGFLDKISKRIFENDNEAAGTNPEKSKGTTLASMSKRFLQVAAGAGTENTIQDIIVDVRENAKKGDIEDSSSFQEVVALMEQLVAELRHTVATHFAGIDLTQLYPTSLFYYLEHEDERKNPSWKRRMHRFCPGIDLAKMDELNHKLALARLSYSDTVEEIRAGLEQLEDPYELVYCDLESSPNEPAHFLAVKRDQSRWGSSLEVLLVVRGTKSVADALTDVLLDSVDYRGGKAHSGILRSGRYIVKKHTQLLEALGKKTGKAIDLTLVGHSLGAGAASIAGIEFNDHDKIAAKVYGFGCPALLSDELSKRTADFITTVVGDADVIPRSSAATVVNALVDVMEYNYMPALHRDINQAMDNIQFLGDTTKEVLLKSVEDLVEQYILPSIKEPTTKRLKPVLFPPGTCIHFYRDGSSISASVVPCTFFNEVEISRRMVDDHLIHNGYELIFLELMRSYHGDHYFRFDQEKDM